jgi:hypothetical protein
MEPIKIGFTGNRIGLNLEQIEQIKLILDNYSDIIILHGDCVGSDTDFHKLCTTYKKTHLDKKIMIHIYPPDNSSLRAFNQGDLLMDEKPYLERNLNIIKNSSILIACPIDKHHEIIRSGTWSTIRQAKKQNVLTYIL